MNAQEAHFLSDANYMSEEEKYYNSIKESIKDNALKGKYSLVIKHIVQENYIGGDLRSRLENEGYTVTAHRKQNTANQIESYTISW
jgi:hypothetical protein